MSKDRKNTAVSVRGRLLKLSRERGVDFHALAMRYAIERFLYRLSVSKYRECFVLKGAMLFAAWTEMPQRPTRDLDLTGFVGDDRELILSIINDIGRIDYEDGMIYKTNVINVERIREEQVYRGFRVRFKCCLANIELTLQIDIGIGDTVSPGAVELDYPVILDEFDIPNLRACRVETMIAEKLHAIVVLGLANSRMKDFFDLWRISLYFDIDGNELLDAVQATFEQRKTQVTDRIPIGLSDEFADDKQNQIQWKSFIKRMMLDEDLDLRAIVTRLREFTLPLFKAVLKGVPFTAIWNTQGVWKERSTNN